MEQGDRLPADERVACSGSFVAALSWLVETQTSSSPRSLGWRTALPSRCRPHHRQALHHCCDPLHIRGHHDRRSYRLPRFLSRVLDSALRYASECWSMQYSACTQQGMSLFAFSSSRELQNLYSLFLRRGGMLQHMLLSWATPPVRLRTMSLSSRCVTRLSLPIHHTACHVATASGC